jgi:hypothetical protein
MASKKLTTGIALVAIVGALVMVGLVVFDVFIFQTEFDAGYYCRQSFCAQ